MQETSQQHSTVRVRPLVIGIGAPFRGDDELGLSAVKTLWELLTEQDVDFATHSDDPARIIDQWSGRDSVIVIDAVRTGAPPGTLHRMNVTDTGLAPRSRTSSHGNALADAIGLSRALGTLPARLIVLGIEPAAMGLGDEMSEACRAALPELIESAVKEITCMSHR